MYSLVQRRANFGLRAELGPFYHLILYPQKLYKIWFCLFARDYFAYCTKTCARSILAQNVCKCKSFFYIFPYLSSIHEKEMYRYVLDGMSALVWELLYPGHLSST